MNLSLKILYFKNYSNLENIIMNKFRLRKQYEEKSRHLLQAEADRDLRQKRAIYGKFKTFMSRNDW